MQHEWAAHGYGIIGKGTRRGSDNKCGPEREMQLSTRPSQTKIQTPSQRGARDPVSHHWCHDYIISQTLAHDKAI